MPVRSSSVDSRRPAAVVAHARCDGDPSRRAGLMGVQSRGPGSVFGPAEHGRGVVGQFEVGRTS